MPDCPIAHIRKEDNEVQSLADHLRESACLAGGFADRIGLKSSGYLLGLVHDLGKASSEFQQYIRSATGLISPDEDDYVDTTGKRGMIDHSTAGAQAIHSRLSPQGGEGALIGQLLALCVASHHSGLIDCLTPDGVDNFQRRISKSHEQTHANEALEQVGILREEINSALQSEDLIPQLLERMRFMREEADSNETFSFKLGLLCRFLFSCLVDADRVSTSDFEYKYSQARNRDRVISWEELIGRFDRHTSRLPMRNEVDNIRQAISNECLAASSGEMGVYLLAVPTGGGKTLASLRFALHHAAVHRMDKIFYFIPFTSIIDQNAQVAREIFEENDDHGSPVSDVVLEHHSNLTPEEETGRQALLAENWDARIVFSTSVQFLEALFSGGTRSARRMHQLANSVIVFDEVQSIPLRCIHMFNLALRFLTKTCGSTVVLCTATQPLLDKVSPRERSLPVSARGQIISDHHALFRRLRRVQVHDRRKPGGWTMSEVVELAMGELRDSKSVLIVVNTKVLARELYMECGEAVAEGIYHLSTAMCPRHRMDVLDEVKSRLRHELPTICISTQLIEAGVDVDFGSVIRFVAGLDSITQAAGRCNRNGRRSRGNVFVVNPTNENLDRLREIKLGAEIAERLLDEFREGPEGFDGDPLSPMAIERYYRYYFHDRREEMGYRVTPGSAFGRHDMLFNALSLNALSKAEYERQHDAAPRHPLRQSFQAAGRTFQAIESSTRGIVVPYGSEGKRIINELCSLRDPAGLKRLLRLAQKYSVNVYEHLLVRLARDGAIHQVQDEMEAFYLDEQHYSDAFGLSTDIVDEMQTLTA
jgi:CRISPR-associated endonuclease/helicase Cas3